MHVCRVTHRQEIFLMVLQLLGLIYLHKRGKNRGRVEEKTCAVRQRNLQGFVRKHLATRQRENTSEMIKSDTNDIKNHQSRKKKRND